MKAAFSACPPEHESGEEMFEEIAVVPKSQVTFVTAATASLRGAIMPPIPQSVYISANSRAMPICGSANVTTRIGRNILSILIIKRLLCTL